MGRRVADPGDVVPIALSKGPSASEPAPGRERLGLRRPGRHNLLQLFPDTAKALVFDIEAALTGWPPTANSFHTEIADGLIRPFDDGAASCDASKMRVRNVVDVGDALKVDHELCRFRGQPLRAGMLKPAHVRSAEPSGNDHPDRRRLLDPTNACHWFREASARGTPDRRRVRAEQMPGKKTRVRRQGRNRHTRATW